MVKLPGGFSPKRAIQQVGSFVNPTGGVANYDVFSDWGDQRGEVQGQVTGGETSAPLQEMPLLQPVGGGGGGTVDRDAALRNTLRQEILARGGDIESIYNLLFGDLDNLVKARDTELEEQYGRQFKSAADKYADAIPQIETSYAAIGAGDSTDNTYAKVGAKKGFEDTTATIGENKKSDKAKLGQYASEQKAKFNADKESAKRNVARAGETDDVDALRGMRNDVEKNIDTAGVTRATLGTDAGARGEVSRITSDSGRYDAAINALDSVIKSSLGGGVKEAAVKAITDNAGLSDEEKKKVQQQFGNVYAEQAAL